MFELSHLLGAKVGHYEILSMDILGFMFIFKGDKKFKFKGYEGLTGETKILPKNEKSNPTPYLLFPTLFYIVELVAVVLVFAFFSSSENQILKNVSYFLLIVGVIGGMIEIYSILPLHMDTPTDGYYLRLVSNPKNKEAFNELLRVEYEINSGNKDVEIKTFTEITSFTADLNLNKVYMLLDNDQYDEAEKLLDIIIEGSKNESHKIYLRAKSQKIFIRLIQGDLEENKKYYDKEVPMSERREISTDVSMASIRAYVLMSGLLDKSRSEVELCLKNVIKAFKRSPKNRQPTELKLFNKALNKVIVAHPTWHLEGYLLEEIKKEEEAKATQPVIEEEGEKNE